MPKSKTKSSSISRPKKRVRGRTQTTRPQPSFHSRSSPQVSSPAVSHEVSFSAQTQFAQPESSEDLWQWPFIASYFAQITRSDVEVLRRASCATSAYIVGPAQNTADPLIVPQLGQHIHNNASRRKRARDEGETEEHERSLRLSDHELVSHAGIKGIRSTASADLGEQAHRETVAELAKLAEAELRRQERLSKLGAEASRIRARLAEIGRENHKENILQAGDMRNKPEDASSSSSSVASPHDSKDQASGKSCSLLSSTQQLLFDCICSERSDSYGAEMYARTPASSLPPLPHPRPSSPLPLPHHRGSHWYFCSWSPLPGLISQRCNCPLCNTISSCGVVPAPASLPSRNCSVRFIPSLLNAKFQIPCTLVNSSLNTAIECRHMQYTLHQSLHQSRSLLSSTNDQLHCIAQLQSRNDISEPCDLGGSAWVLFPKTELSHIREDQKYMRYQPAASGALRMSYDRAWLSSRDHPHYLLERFGKFAPVALRGLVAMGLYRLPELKRLELMFAEENSAARSEVNFLIRDKSEEKPCAIGRLVKGLAPSLKRKVCSAKLLHGLRKENQEYISARSTDAAGRLWKAKGLLSDKQVSLASERTCPASLKSLDRGRALNGFVTRHTFSDSTQWNDCIRRSALTSTEPAVEVSSGFDSDSNELDSSQSVDEYEQMPSSTAVTLLRAKQAKSVLICLDEMLCGMSPAVSLQDRGSVLGTVARLCELRSALVQVKRLANDAVQDGHAINLDLKMKFALLAKAAGVVSPVVGMSIPTIDKTGSY